MDVLVVDDEPTNCEIARIILETAGYRVMVASNALDALSLCHDQETGVDLVLMDVQMPVMNGIEAIRRLRGHPVTHATPVLCISAKVDGLVKDQALEAGCNHFLEKPYTRSQLLHALQHTLDQSARIR